MGHLLLAQGALGFPNSSGPSPVGEGGFGGCPGAAPWGTGEAFAGLARLSHSPRKLGGASPGGLRRGASEGTAGFAQSRGGCSLGAQGQARLAWPQLGRGAWGWDPGLGGGPRHRDGGSIVRTAGRIHIGHHGPGQPGRRWSLLSRSAFLLGSSSRFHAEGRIPFRAGLRGLPLGKVSRVSGRRARAAGGRTMRGEAASRAAGRGGAC